MKYYKDINNQIYAFEDNVTQDIINDVAKKHNTKLTEITETQYKSFKLFGTFDKTEEEIEAKESEIKLKQIKITKKSELTTAFRAQLSQGYVCPTSNIKMNATLEDIDKLQKGYDLEVKLGSSEMTIRDYNNDYHNLSLQDVETMLTELGQNYKNQLAKLWKLKDKVEAATSVEELDAISWDENE